MVVKCVKIDYVLHSVADTHVYMPVGIMLIIVLDKGIFNVQYSRLVWHMALLPSLNDHMIWIWFDALKGNMAF